MFVRGESHAIFKEAHGLVIDYIFVSLSCRCRPPLDSYFSERNMHRRHILQGVGHSLRGLPLVYA